MTRWDAARQASQRTMRKYKPVGPVSSVPGSGGITHEMVMRTPTPLLCVNDVAACRACGHIQCSCERQAEVKWAKALDATRRMMAEHPEFDTVICSPIDAERLSVLGLTVKPHVYARKGQWHLYAEKQERERLEKQTALWNADWVRQSFERLFEPPQEGP